MKKFIAIFCVCLCALGAFAAEVEQSGWIGVDFAYYFLSSPTAEAGSTWRNVSGPYSGLEGRVTPWYQAKVKIPGNGALTAGNNIKFQEGLEVTPVSLMARTKIVVEPIAFLNFSGGVDMGTGWDCGNLFQGGMGDSPVWTSYKKKDGSTAYKYYYTPRTAFDSFFLEPWVEAMFQFDVAAVVPADKQEWLHIVLQATYKVKYTALTGVPNGTPWIWQLTGNKFNGWNWESYITLGYAFPESVKVISLAGVQVQLDSYFDNVASPAFAGYSTKFLTVGISPTAVLKFDAHNSLACQVRFKNRRSYESVDPQFTGPFGIQNGQEWFFDRLALSYTYTF